MFRLWEETGMETDGELCMLLVDDIIHVQEVVRQASSEALAKIIDEYQDYLPAVLQVLLEKYNEKLYVSQQHILILPMLMLLMTQN